MDGQIIVRKRLVSSLLLQYQLLFLCILRRKHHHLRKKKNEKDFGCENYLKIERKKSFRNTSERITTIRPIIYF